MTITNKRESNYLLLMFNGITFTESTTINNLEFASDQKLNRIGHINTVARRAHHPYHPRPSASCNLPSASESLGLRFFAAPKYKLYNPAALLSQIHETIETINQLKTQREFMLSFARDPQGFINDWLQSQCRDLK
eukprot:g31968.t1